MCRFLDFSAVSIFRACARLNSFISASSSTTRFAGTVGHFSSFPFAEVPLGDALAFLISATLTRNCFASLAKLGLHWFSSSENSQRFLSWSHPERNAEYAAAGSALRLISTASTTFVCLTVRSLSLAAGFDFAVLTVLFAFCVHKQVSAADGFAFFCHTL